jgi:hypothetical protein
MEIQPQQSKKKISFSGTAIIFTAMAVFFLVASYFVGNSFLKTDNLFFVGDVFRNLTFSISLADILAIIGCISLFIGFLTSIIGAIKEKRRKTFLLMVLIILVLMVVIFLINPPSTQRFYRTIHPLFQGDEWSPFRVESFYPM